MSISWKKSQFFERNTIPDATTKKALNIFQQFKPTCSDAGCGFLFFGSDGGFLRIVNRSYALTDVQLYGYRFIDMQQVDRSNILLTLGEEKENDDMTLKIWKINEAGTTSEDILGQVRSMRVFCNTKVTGNYSCFSANSDQTSLIIAYDDGKLLMLNTNIIRDRNANFKLVSLPGCTSCITNVVYNDSNSTTSNPYVYMITQEACFHFNYKSPSAVITSLDDVLGCATHCAAISPTNNQLCIVGKQTLFIEELDRLNCYVNHTQVIHACFFQHFLVVVSLEEDSNVAGVTAKQIVTIFDLRSKLIAHYARVEPVFALLTSWHSLLVVLTNGNVIALTDTSITTKISTLLKRNLFSIALSLAQSYSCEESVISSITKEYADHMYARGDFETAIKLYGETIGFVEASSIIRKFLDAQKIEHLTIYLEQLHTRKCASPDHTELLLTCFCKLRQIDKLDTFVSQQRLFAKSGGIVWDPAYLRYLQRSYDVTVPKSVIFSECAVLCGKNSNIGFDVLNVIRCYTECHYPNHAMFLSLLYGIHHSYIAINQELERFEQVLQYIKSLPVYLALFFFLRHGTALLPYDRASITTLAISICLEEFTPSDVTHTVVLPSSTGSGSTNSSSNSSNSNNNMQSPSNAASSNNIVTITPSVTIRIDEHGHARVVHGIDSTLKQITIDTNNVSSSNAIDNNPHATVMRQLKVLPSLFYPIFSTDIGAFLVFLEALVAHDLKNPNYFSNTESKRLWNTLLETYLIVRGSNESSMSILQTSQDGGNNFIPPVVPAYENCSRTIHGTQYSTQESIQNIATSKIYSIIQNYITKVDVQQAILLQETSNFTPALQALLSSLSHYHELLLLALSSNDLNTAIHVCRKNGKVHKSLWLNLFTHITNMSSHDMDLHPHIQECLEEALTNVILSGELSSVTAIQLLAKTDKVTFSCIKTLLSKFFQQKVSQTKNDLVELERYKADMTKLQQEKQTLQSRSTIFKDVDCARCHNPQTLPTVHFLCLHSFHSHCAGDMDLSEDGIDKECSICSIEHRKVKQIKQSLMESVMDHDKFLSKLDDSSDGFSVIAEYFGRGAFDVNLDA